MHIERPPGCQLKSFLVQDFSVAGHRQDLGVEGPQGIEGADALESLGLQEGDAVIGG